MEQETSFESSVPPFIILCHCLLQSRVFRVWIDNRWSENAAMPSTSCGDGWASLMELPDHECTLQWPRTLSLGVQAVFPIQLEVVSCVWLLAGDLDDARLAFPKIAALR